MVWIIVDFNPNVFSDLSLLICWFHLFAYCSLICLYCKDIFMFMCTCMIVWKYICLYGFSFRHSLIVDWFFSVAYIIFWNVLDINSFLLILLLLQCFFQMSKLYLCNENIHLLHIRRCGISTNETKLRPKHNL